MEQTAAAFHGHNVRKARALASPVRSAIIDGLEVLGPASIARIAASLGDPAGGLYHHLAPLERNGLVVRADPRKPTAAARVRLPDDPATRRDQLNDPRQQEATASVGATVRSATRSGWRARLT